MTTTRGKKRDVSAVLELLGTADVVIDRDGKIAARVLNAADYMSIVNILTDLDARTGRRDPSKRKRARSK